MGRVNDSPPGTPSVRSATQFARPRLLYGAASPTGGTEGPEERPPHERREGRREKGQPPPAGSEAPSSRHRDAGGATRCRHSRLQPRSERRARGGRREQVEAAGLTVRFSPPRLPRSCRIEQAPPHSSSLPRLGWEPRGGREGAAQAATVGRRGLCRSRAGGPSCLDRGPGGSAALRLSPPVWLRPTLLPPARPPSCPPARAGEEKGGRPAWPVQRESCRSRTRGLALRGSSRPPRVAPENCLDRWNWPGAPF